MSVRRFDFDDHGNWIAHSYGDYCVYDDALKEFQSSLAEREQRIARLEAALRHEISKCSNCEGKGYFTCGKCKNDLIHDCQYCASARAALAVTEGEKRE